MSSPDSELTAELPPWLSAAISILFWISLSVAAALYAALVLSPRLSESLSLQERYIHNAIKAHSLRQEIDHLALVADALENDPDFVSRVATQELAVGASDVQQIYVNDNLNFDARIPHVKPLVPPQPPWYAHSVHELAQASPLRKRWTLATVILFGVSFVCLNDGFFSNRIGSTMLRMGRCVANRYQTPTKD